MIRSQPILFLVTAVAAFAPLTLAAQTELISVNATGTAAARGRNLDEDEVPGAISPEGRYVAFWSSSSDFGPTDTNGQPDVYVRDRLTGTTLLASVNDDGTDSGNGTSDGVGMMSGNGRCVVFGSTADDLHPLDTDTDQDIFVRDFVAGTTTLVSVNATGTASGNGVSVSPWIDETCTLVAFHSLATDLSDDTDSDTLADVYLRDLVAGTTRLVSQNAAGTDSANATAGGLTMTPDGAHLLFQSQADNLVTGISDTNGTTDLFFYDVAADSLEVVSVVPGGAATGDSFSFGGVPSADGACVAFRSNATDLTAEPTNGVAQIYLRDLVADATEMVSIATSGTAGGDAQSISARIGEGCRYVTFDSFATDLTGANTFGERQVYRRDTVLDVTDLVSVNSGGTNGGNDTSDGPVMSRDGRWVAFESNASDLVAIDGDTTEDVYLRDMDSGETILMSSNAAGTDSSDANSENVAFGTNAAFLIFESRGSDLTSITDSNSTKDVFLFVTGAATDLTIAKTDSPDPVVAGNSLSYTVTVENSSSSTDATGVVVTDTPPAALSGFVTTGCDEDPGGVPTCTLGTVLAGTSVQYSITADVDPGASGTIGNMVTVTADTPDPDASNDTATESTAVTALTSFSVSLSGTGTGEVTSVPTGIACPADCSESFPEGTPLTLSANPDPDSIFAGWTGCDTATDSLCTLTVSGATQEVVAEFQAQANVLEIPTLGEIGLILLALLIAAAGIPILRST